LSEFNPVRGLVIVTIGIFGPLGGKIVRLAVDTGSLPTVIHPKHLAEIGYDVSQASGSTQIITASGTVDVHNFTLVHMNALGQRQDDVPVISHALPLRTRVDGLLGLDFVRQQRQRLIVDFRTGQVTLD